MLLRRPVNVSKQQNWSQAACSTCVRARGGGEVQRSSGSNHNVSNLGEDSRLVALREAPVGQTPEPAALDVSQLQLRTPSRRHL